MGKIYDELAPLEGTEEFFEQILNNSMSLSILDRALRAHIYPQTTN